MNRRLLSASVLLLASVGSAAVRPGSAQATALDSLTRIRVQQTGRPHWLTGRLLAADSQALTVEHRGGPYELPLSAVRRVDVSVGFRSSEERVKSGAKRSFLLAAAVGGALLVLGAAVDLTTECADCMLPASAVALGVGVSLTASTTAAGALFGALSSRDRWKRVPLPVRIRRS